MLALLLLIAVPILELWVFVQVANAIGFWWALLALATLSIGGAWLTKLAGVGVLGRLRQRVAAGESPDRELADGVLLLVAGLLLLVPGFVTGVIGLLLLLPPVRALVRPLVGRRRGSTRVRVITATYRTGDGPIDVQSTEQTPPRGELGPS
jgi:UPF0716 protein FxsA